MANKIFNFPGIYPQGDDIRAKKPGLKTSEYFKMLYDMKVDKKYTPNTVYGVDENGKQVMIDINEVINIENKVLALLEAKDAPADNKQYARENHEWQEVELYKLKLLDVPLIPENWIPSTESSDYPYEYHVEDERIEEKMVPIVLFKEEDAIRCIFSPVCASFDGYVAIYAREIPSDEVVVPLIGLQ